MIKRPTFLAAIVALATAGALEPTALAAPPQGSAALSISVTSPEQLLSPRGADDSKIEPHPGRHAANDEAFSGVGNPERDSSNARPVPGDRSDNNVVSFRSRLRATPANAVPNVGSGVSREFGRAPSGSVIPFASKTVREDVARLAFEVALSSGHLDYAVAHSPKAETEIDIRNEAPIHKEAPIPGPDGRKYEVWFRVGALSRVKPRFSLTNSATGAVRCPPIKQHGMWVVYEAEVVPSGRSKRKRSRLHQKDVDGGGKSRLSGMLGAGHGSSDTQTKGGLATTASGLSRTIIGGLKIARLRAMRKWRTSWNLMTDAAACKSSSRTRGTAGGRGTAQKGGGYFTNTGAPSTAVLVH